MKKRILLLIILFTFFVSIGTLMLTYNYVDPYEYTILGLFLALFSFILWTSSFFAFILYFIKKIYFRGKVYVQNVLTSFRQWFFISLFIVLLMYFNHLGASIYVVALPLAFALLFLELFFQNLQD